MRNAVFLLLSTPLFFSACNLEEAGGTRQAWILSPEEGVNRTYCVDVTETDGTALDTLRATDEILELLEDPTFGTAVCKVGDTGWPASSCFGTTASDPSWLYFVFDATTGGWKYPGLTEPADPNVPSSLDRYELEGGEVLALVFTTYDADTYEPLRHPPSISFEEICPP